MAFSGRRGPTPQFSGRRGPKPQFTVRLTFDIAPAARVALDELATRNNRLMSDEVRTALERHIERHVEAGGDRDAGGAAGFGPPPWTYALTVVVRPRHKAALDELAARDGRSLAGEARSAVYRYLADEGLVPDEAEDARSAQGRLLTA